MIRKLLISPINQIACRPCCRLIVTML